MVICRGAEGLHVQMMALVLVMLCRLATQGQAKPPVDEDDGAMICRPAPGIGSYGLDMAASTSE